MRYDFPCVGNLQNNMKEQTRQKRTPGNGTDRRRGGSRWARGRKGAGPRPPPGRGPWGEPASREGARPASPPAGLGLGAPPAAPLPMPCYISELQLPGPLIGYCPRSGAGEFTGAT